MPLRTATCDVCSEYGDDDIYLERLIDRLRAAGWPCTSNGSITICPKCLGRKPKLIPTIAEAVAKAKGDA